MSMAGWADCVAPAAAGVVICSPGVEATVAYPAQIAAAASAITGRRITALAAYVNGSRVALVSGSKVTLTEFNLKAGTYSLVVNAWDNTGQLYQAKRTFTIGGPPTNGCATAGPGVTFCSPANGSLQPTNDVVVQVAAKGNDSPIVRLKVWLDGLLMNDSTVSSLTSNAGMGVGTHTLTARAWDKAGNAYTTSTTFKTYYDGVCSPKGCAPGVFITSPAVDDFSGSPFTVAAEVRGNALAIVGMKAYVDGKLVATSQGHTIWAQVPATSGTHELVVNAWDTKGDLYKRVATLTIK